jgi:RimJ/RimL family protein N-acetyltransferase
MAWNSDPEVLHYSEGDDIQAWSLPELQQLYRGISQKPYVFVIEVEGRPIGECWLQEMNLARLLVEHPGQDVRRIDIMIGEQTFWGRGWGIRAVGLLVDLAFGLLSVDVLYACDVADYNPRSRRAFESNGFRVLHETRQPEGGKARVTYDLCLAHSEWVERTGHQ